MTPFRLMSAFAGLAVVITAGVCAPSALAAEDDDGFVPLFNGRDLTGWVNVNGAPGTFFVKDNTLITTGEPISFLRTEKPYENFILELEWMHVNTHEVGNSGVFIWGDPLPVVGSPFTRGIEVQVLVNLEYKDQATGAVTATSHGDVFAIQGATCKPDRPHPKGAMRCLPSEYRAKGGGEWNHYKIIANDGAIKLHVNGQEVSGVSECIPRKGYLALEAEGAECHFRNIRIKELPSSNPKPQQVAKVWQGHQSLFTGLDLSGWKTDANAWTVAGGRLKSNGQADLVSEAKFGACEVFFDWRLPAQAKETIPVSIGTATVHLSADLATKPGTWQRTTIKVEKASHPSPLVFGPAAGLELMNIFIRELPGD